MDGLAAAGLRPRFPRGAQPDGPAAGRVDLLQLVRGVQHLPAGRELRSLDVRAEPDAAQLRVVEQLQQRRADFPDVMRRDVGRHADRDAGRAVDQQVGQPRREHDRFHLRAVVVGPEMHRVLVDLAQQLRARRGETALGVSHRGGAVAVKRPEVAVPVDQGIAQRERLRHAHERVVERDVAMRVVAAHHVADHLGRLAGFGVGAEPLLPHRVENPPLHRFQAVAHIGQRTRGDHRQRVVQIPALGGVDQIDGLLAVRHDGNGAGFPIGSVKERCAAALPSFRHES